MAQRPKKKPVKKQVAKSKQPIPKGMRGKMFINSEYHNLISIFFGIFLLYSLNTKSAGFLPKLMQNVFKGMFGGLSFFVPFILIIFGIFGFIEGNETIYRIRRTKLKYLILFFIIVIYGLINYGTMPTSSPLSIPMAKDIIDIAVHNGGSGLIPSTITYYYTMLLGVFGAWLLTIFLILLSAKFIFKISIKDIIEKKKANSKREVAGEDAGWHTRFNIFKKNAVNSVMEDGEYTQTSKRGILSSLKGLFRSEDDDDYEIDDPLIDKIEMYDPDDKTINIVGFRSAEDEYLEILESTSKFDDAGSKNPSIDNISHGKEEINLVGDDYDLELSALGNLDKTDIMKRRNGKYTELDDIKDFGKRVEGYVIPPSSLLRRVDNHNNLKYEKKTLKTGQLLVSTLRDFGVDVNLGPITMGPTVTRYEVVPEAGVKVSKITSLENDIKRALAVRTVRSEAPIPGKQTVGFEIPNDTPSIVSFRDIVESKEFRESKSLLSIGLGVNIDNQVIVADITEMPHLLIAGSTGAGKSVCINTIINSILFKCKPDEVKLILVDPKMVELSCYDGIPHLLIPVVTDPKKAANALNWAVSEMTRRYKLFAEARVKDINGYNKKSEEKLPKIVIIIDELADLMMVSAKEVEEAVMRIAQLARACGMHLIVATQRPSVDIVTGTIKNNIPARIAFSVSSQIDSRTILDKNGAESLIGKGDMLFAAKQSNEPQRIQGAFLSDEEIERVIEFVKAQAVEEEDKGLKEDIMEKISKVDLSESDEVDEFLEEAIKLVVDTGQASASMLQRRFKIGFNRAARLIDDMEERGIVGASEGSKPRKVLISKEEYDNL